MRRLQNTVVLGCGRPVWEYREVCAFFVSWIFVQINKEELYKLKQSDNMESIKIKRNQL